jgi:hypothetical protein
MKILFISHLVPYPPVSGALLRNYNLIKNLAKNHEVYLVTLNQKALLASRDLIDKSIKEINSICSYIRVFDMLANRNRILKYLYLFFNLFSRNPYSVWLYRSKKMKKEIEMLIVNVKFDLVSC